jgi:pyruvate carboxylase subunit B
MPPDDRDAASSESASAEGTPYRALLPEGSAFDVTLHERAGQLTLRATTANAGDETSGGDESGGGGPERVAYRFEPVGGDRSRGHFLLLIGGRSVPVTVTPAAGEGAVRVTLGGRTRVVQVKGETELMLERFGLAEAASADEAEVRAPMPGLVVRVMVEEGAEVGAGDGLLVLEAMKMENELRAPVAGTVAAIYASEGASADKGEVLVEIE